MSDRNETWDPFGAWPAARRWLWAALAAMVCLSQGADFVSSLRPGPTEGVDFFQEWSSARNWLEGVPVYTDLEAAAKRYLGYTLRPGEEMPFTKNAHPPTSVLLAVPFALINYPDSTLLWNVSSLVAFAFTLWLIGRAVGLTPGPWLVLPALVLLLTCNPFRQQVNQGQLNLVLLLLLTGTWFAERSGRPRSAGILLGLATAIKIFPAFFFLYYTLRRRWSVLISGLAGFVACTVITVAILGPETYRSYLGDVVPLVSSYRNDWLNASLTGFWIKWFDSGAISRFAFPDLPRYLPPVVGNPAVATVGLILSSLGVLVAWAWAVLRARTQEQQDVAFGVTTTTMLLLAPVAWDHYMLLLILPVTQLWIARATVRRGRILLLLILACLWLNPLFFWNALLPVPTVINNAAGAALWSLVAVSLQFFALIGLFLLGLKLQEELLRCAPHESRSNRNPSGSFASIAPLSGTSDANVSS